MRIAQLAPLVESVPPSGYGGTELVVSYLTEGLVAAGHEVTLFAAGESQTSAALVAVTRKPLRLDQETPVRRWSAYAQLQLLAFESRLHEFDIVHNHMGYEAFSTLRQAGLPSVTTNHNLIKSYCAPLYLASAGLPYVAISNAYRRLNYPEKLNYAATIYNGIDFSTGDYNCNDSRSYLLFLGRVCQDKGTATAIEVAHRLALPLLIAGKIDQADRQYFDHFVKPHLDSTNVQYIGEVGARQKWELYCGARAVVYPVAFDEPFGLVVVEALSSGTPVMGFRRGAIPELIVDGETGIVGMTVEDLVKRFSEVELISPEKCREHAVSRFSKERMLAEYIQLYESLCQ